MEKMYSVALVGLRFEPNSVSVEVRSWTTLARSASEANGKGLLKAQNFWPREDDWVHRVNSSEVPT